MHTEKHPGQQVDLWETGNARTAPHRIAPTSREKSLPHPAGLEQEPPLQSFLNGFMQNIDEI
jgi:hypothetical protein